MKKAPDRPPRSQGGPAARRHRASVLGDMAAASHDGAVRCLLAIELSKKSWIVAVNTPLSDKISRHTLQACDWKGLLELIERIRTRVSQTFSRPVEVISCYEAGYDGFWLHRLLEAHGVRNFVVDPASVQVDRRARRVKTAFIDGVSARGAEGMERCARAKCYRRR
jgi:transposase